MFRRSAYEISSPERDEEDESGDLPVPYRRSSPRPGNFDVAMSDSRWPCQKPPWGRLTAVDAATGEVSWQVPVGVTEGLPTDRQNTGRPGRAAAIVTGGGVVFIASTDDTRFSALDAATGSEVWIALEVAKMLSDLNIKVVNLACWELFEDQDSSYKKNILKCNNNTLIVSVEAGITDGWQKYTGRNGLNIGINTFGESAPGKVVAEHFKLTPEGVVDKIKHRMDAT